MQAIVENNRGLAETYESYNGVGLGMLRIAIFMSKDWSQRKESIS
jgi:hypothetical protein